MTEPRTHPIPQMAEFREQLREMAVREVAAGQHVRWRRRAFRRPPRRAALGLVLAGVLVATAATGSQLISVGAPDREPKIRGKVNVGVGIPRVVAIAPDEAAGRPWGVGVFKNTKGGDCFTAGQVRGDALGLVKRGVFRPYDSHARSACTSYPLHGIFDFFHVYMLTDFRPARVLVYGRAPAGVRSVRFTLAGHADTTQVSPERAFIFVFSPKSTDSWAIEQVWERHAKLDYFDASGRLCRITARGCKT